MSDISPLSQSHAAAYNVASTTARSERVAGPTVTRQQDAVEFSSRARMLSKMTDLPEVRQQLIDRVKAEIEAGEYETPQRIDQAVNNLVDDLETGLA